MLAVELGGATAMRRADVMTMLAMELLPLGFVFISSITTWGLNHTFRNYMTGMVFSSFFFVAVLIVLKSRIYFHSGKRDSHIRLMDSIRRVAVENSEAGSDPWADLANDYDGASAVLISPNVADQAIPSEIATPRPFQTKCWPWWQWLGLAVIIAELIGGLSWIGNGAGTLGFFPPFLMVASVLLILAYSLQRVAPFLIGRAAFIMLGMILVFGFILNGVATFLKDHNDRDTTGVKAIVVPPLNGKTYNKSQTNFQRRMGYPLCAHRFGNLEMGERKQLTALDISIFAYAVYYNQKSNVMQIVESGTNGTDLEGVQLEYLEDTKTVGRWGVFAVPAAKTRIVAIRGTYTFDDAMADAHLWAAIKVMQDLDYVAPVMHFLPPRVIQEMNADLSLRKILGEPQIWARLDEAVKDARRTSSAQGWSTIVTGHSLGGGLAQIVGSRGMVQTLTWSPVGVLYSLKRFKMLKSMVYASVVNVEPDKDIVPRIDEQIGVTQRISCKASFIECHKLARSICEVYRSCGDPRMRSFAEQCKIVVGKKWRPFGESIETLKDYKERMRERLRLDNQHV